MSYLHNMNALLIKIVIAVFVITTLGFLSGFSTIQEISQWYVYIKKPSFNPPNWIFGPVWTVLYILMGISFAFIWNVTRTNKKKAILLFTIQFILNLLWSFLFFNLHFTGIAFVEILLMLFFILLTIRSFYTIHKTAAYLLIPYLIWVSFASLLNGSIWFLNK